ncbi:MAG: SDR family NAD(P)-dependent oxidoreductase [Hyphomicrobiales bacterium]|nr:SDR family NAD(P)-dependent oxidoreductase [Hyphomicrobiales bacterium]MDE2113875.1 SDR family NAD(P)-dependent oxidoreductase [Hyphomicrobiales bacterium]
MKLDKSIAAIVTGGASGLGAASARQLAAKGVRVAIFDLQAVQGQALAAEIGGVFCEVDVTSEASVDAGLAKARAAHGIERVLVNCAGIATSRKIATRKRDSGEILMHDIASFQRTIAINLVGTFQMMAKSSVAMMTLDPLNAEGARGIMINTASVAAEDGQMGQVAYAASKGGVLAMTLPVARDLASQGIRVMTIMPGLFHTPMFDGLPEAAQKALADSVPFPSRLGKPEEYAALVQSICENDMLNGTGIRLDGAVRLGYR